MRIAYLILCHKNFDQLEMLIRALDCQEDDFYIHVEKKVTEYPIMKGDNIFYLEDNSRISIKWASYEMIRATIRLIERCLQSDKLYDYIVLLSGQDYPIKSKEEIHEYFAENNHWNFIEIKNDNGYYHKIYEKRNSIIYPAWMLRRNYWARAIKRIYIYITGGNTYTFPILRRRNTTNLRLYYGSQWWALHRECLQWILTYIKTHPDIEKFFAHSMVPDECFFQTIFMASPYSGKRKDKIVYMKWDGNHPRVIDKATASFLVSQHNRFLFARKFDINTNKDALDLVSTIHDKS